jgi:hypothetical protein
MKKAKSIWTSITGSISAFIPMLFVVCKSGACGAVCVSPLASLLGISSASLIASPMVKSLFPLLLVISAVSFTVSYYKIYLLPKYAVNSCDTDCGCEPVKNSFQQKFSLWAFWIGLIVSVIFFVYFEIQTYKAEMVTNTAEQSECCSPSANSVHADDDAMPSDTTKACCSDGKKCN